VSCWECGGGPRQEFTARSRWLGAELRAKRLDAGLTVEDAARELDWHPDKLTGLELGDPGPDDIDVAEFLTLVGAPTAVTRHFIQVNRDAAHDTWLQSFDGDPSLRIRTPLHEESRSIGITGYHPMLIPAQLRTSAYSRAVCGLDQPAARHTTLAGLDAVFYVEEQAVRDRAVGTAALMREQLRHLVRSPATILVVPARSPVACEGFTILDNAQGRPVVHLEITVANLFLENPDHVAVYRTAVAEFAGVAWDANTSRDLLADCAERSRSSASRT
jgi:hypothetical protein